MSDLDVLRRLGEQLVPPPLDSLRDTARRRDRRGAVATVIASGAVLAVISTGAVLLGAGDRDAAPGPVDEPGGTGSTTHPLTYADGATIHYGERAIRADGVVVELDLTDRGVGFRTRDGRIWFSDGSATEQVGTLGDPVLPTGELEDWSPSGVLMDGESGGWVVSGNSGSRLMWFDFTGPGDPEVVVHDTGTRETVLRTRVHVPEGGWVGPHSVTEDSAYLFRDPDPVADDRMPQARLDLTTGEQEPVSPEGYLADVDDHPARSLHVSHAETGFRLYEITEGTGHQFDVHRGRLRPMGMQPIEVRDGLTGERLALRAPEGHPDTNPVWLVQWLDDDSVVILDPTGGRDRLLVCPVPAGTCEVTVTAPGPVVVPDWG